LAIPSMTESSLENLSPLLAKDKFDRNTLKKKIKTGSERPS